MSIVYINTFRNKEREAPDLAITPAIKDAPEATVVAVTTAANSLQEKQEK